MNEKYEANVEMSAFCKWCGESLSSDHTGPCPKCGREGKTVHVKIRDSLGIRDSLFWERRREFFEENPKIKILLLGITFGSPIIGLICSGILGLIVGFVFSLVSYLLGPYAVIKVREIERGNSY